MLPNKQTKLNLAILLMTAALSMAAVSYAAPMGTAFTYQGRLADANSPADGLYDFEFAVFNALDGGSQQGSTLSEDDKDVIDGYFTVTLNFGAGVFTGDARWLQIAVRPGAGTEDFTPLSPRQELTPTPYALYALSGTQGPKGDKGDTGDTGPQGPMGPEGPAADAAFSIEDFVALGQIDAMGMATGIGTITINDLSSEPEGIFGIRFGISAWAPGQEGLSEAVDEVELILDAGNPWLLSLIEDLSQDPADAYPNVLVTLGIEPGMGTHPMIRLDMQQVKVNSVDLFGYSAGAPSRLAYVSLSIQDEFTLHIADAPEIRYRMARGGSLYSGPTCSEVISGYYPQVSVGPVHIPDPLSDTDIRLSDYDLQISISSKVGPCASTITTKVWPSYNDYENTACVWANCLDYRPIDTVWLNLFLYDFDITAYYIDRRFEISQAFPQRVKMYSINESSNINPVQMQMTYSMDHVVIRDHNPGGDPLTVVSCQQ